MKHLVVFQFPNYMFCLDNVFCLFVQEIGEEFVEFLEKELNITDTDVVENNEKSTKGYESKESASGGRKEGDKGSSIEENIDDIEAALSQLKKELGL